MKKHAPAILLLMLAMLALPHAAAADSSTLQAAWTGTTAEPCRTGGFFIALGIFFLILEILTPLTFGLLAFNGILAIIAGSFLLRGIPCPLLHRAAPLLIPFLLANSVIAVFLAARVIKAHQRKASAGAESLIGETGTAETDFTEEGQVFVKGELWTALSADRRPLAKGEKIKVTGVDKVKLIVTKYDFGADATTPPDQKRSVL